MSLALVKDQADTLPTEEGLTKRQFNLFMELTPLQQRVARGVLEGKSQRQAYIEARGKAKAETTIDSGATEILSNPKVKAFMESVIFNQLNESIITRDKALEELSEDVRNRNSKEADYKELARVRHSAIKQIADIQGWNKKSDVTVNNRLISGVIVVPEDKTLEEALAEYTVVDVD